MDNESGYLWSQVFVSLARGITGSVRERDFVAHFGVSPFCAVVLWFLFLLPHMPADTSISAIHVLWALWFLKSTPTNWSQAGSRFGVDERTFKFHLFEVLRVIDASLPEVCYLFFFILFIV